MFCPQCGSPVADGSSFCGKCGAPQTPFAPGANSQQMGYRPQVAQPQTHPDVAPSRKSKTTTIVALIVAVLAIVVIVAIALFVALKPAPQADVVSAPNNATTANEADGQIESGSSNAGEAGSGNDDSIQSYLEGKHKADEARFQGDWMLSGGMSDGTELDAEAIDAMQQMGLYVYMQLNEDGSVVMSQFGTDLHGNWEVKDAATVAITVEGDTVDCALENDELVLEVQGDSLKFKKGEIPAEAFDQGSESDSRSRLSGTYGGTGMNSPADRHINVQVDGDTLTVRGNLSMIANGSYSSLVDGDEWSFVLTPDTTYSTIAVDEIQNTRDEFLGSLPPDHFVSLRIQVEDGYVVSLSTSA